MPLKITTGSENYEVLDTGSVITYKDEPLAFELSPDLRIVVKFIKDSEIKEQKMDFKVISNNELELLLTNFNSSLGIGNAAPLPLAKLNNKQVYLNFMVYALNDSDNKTMHYTWYLREEVKNG